MARQNFFAQTKRYNSTGSDNDPGFGKNVYGNARLLNPDGSANVIRKGVSFYRSTHIYRFLIFSSWPKFLSLTLLFYAGVNLFFGMLYMAIGIKYIDGDSSAPWMDKFWQALAFSAQTLTTVGYGKLSPNGWLCNLIAATEALFGLLCFAVVTGLVYSRFARPNIKLRFSRKIIVAPYQEGSALMFRFINERKTQLVEAEATVLTSIQQAGGRKFYPLHLERSKIALLALNWTVVHPIDDQSPFHNLSESEIELLNPEILVLIKGFDETFGQTVYQRTSYTWDQWQFGAAFEPITKFSSEFSAPVLYANKIDATKKAPLKVPSNSF